MEFWDLLGYTLPIANWGALCSHFPEHTLFSRFLEGMVQIGSIPSQDLGTWLLFPAMAQHPCLLPCSGPDPHPESGQSRRLVEVHGEHHLRVQAGNESYSPR